MQTLRQDLGHLLDTGMEVTFLPYLQRRRRSSQRTQGTMATPLGVILTAAMGSLAMVWVVEEEGGRRKRQMVVSPLF